jgi:D-arabinose 1-dehydrogenase-like Zn-dependent alcohol dehydrogenase
MAQMRAVVAERPDRPVGLVVREVPRPEPRPGWALVRVEAFGLNRSEYKTLKGYAGAAVTFPRILGIELVGVVEAVHGNAPAVLPGTTVAALMGEMDRAFDGSYAEYALVPEHQLIALETTLPWDVLGALPETFVTAAGSLEHLDLEEGETLLLRGATSSVGLACLELASAAGVRVIATTRSEAKGSAPQASCWTATASPSALAACCPRAAPTALSTSSAAPRCSRRCASTRSRRRSTRTAGWRRTRRPASSSCCRAPRPRERTATSTSTSRSRSATSSPRRGPVKAATGRIAVSCSPSAARTRTPAAGACAPPRAGLARA